MHPQTRRMECPPSSGEHGGAPSPSVDTTPAGGKIPLAPGPCARISQAGLFFSSHSALLLSLAAHGCLFLAAAFVAVSRPRAPSETDLTTTIDFAAAEPSDALSAPLEMWPSEVAGPRLLRDLLDEEPEVFAMVEPEANALALGAARVETPEIPPEVLEWRPTVRRDEQETRETLEVASDVSRPTLEMGAGAEWRAPRPLVSLNRSPQYPPAARRLGHEGRVLLEVEVLIDGTVGGVEVVESSGHGVLDAAAARAVRGWKFEPARRGDTPVASKVLVPVRFALE